MATYDSIHTGTAVDQAVERTLNNKSIGDSSTPIKLDANGQAIVVTKSTVPTENDGKLITSGAMYTALAEKYNKADIATSPDLGTSTTLAPSQKAVKTYADKVFSDVQPTVVAGDGVTKTGNVLSVDPTGFMNPDELTGKREHYGEYVVGYDGDVLSKVEAAKHSSFDLSKFTIVGSPIVTSDGIASGFSDSNYINTGLAITYSSQNKIIIKSRIKTPKTDETPSFNTYWAYGGDYEGIYLCAQNSTRLIIQNFAGNKNLGYLDYYAKDTWYDITLELDIVNNTQKTTFTNIATGTTVERSNSFTLTFGSNKLYIGKWIIGTGNQHPATYGSIDLKQFSITVDGVPVFNGNKTGIDTIKPDDYTVVGSPTITDDGVVSGFASNEYLTTGVSLPLDKDFDFEIEATIQNSTVSQYLVGGTFNSSHDIIPFVLECGNGLIRTYFTVDNNGTDNTLSKIVNTTLNNGDRIRYVVSRRIGAGKYIMRFYKNGIELNNDSNNYVESSLNIRQSSNIIIGRLKTNYAGSTWAGSVNLNSIKLYVDGDLVYQPCLKIPYTLSKDGKKIVDEYYRERVEDEVEQATFTPYYTLQSENKGNYAVVGSPTISSDFVASGFSNSNFITTPIPTFTNNIEIYGSFYFIHNSINQMLYNLSVGNTSETRYALSIFIAPANRISFNSTADGTTWAGAVTGITSLVEGQKYYYKFVYKNSNMTLYLSTDGTNYTQEGTFAGTLYTSYGSSRIGISAVNNDEFLGSIDLKSLKIYVDGNLAYQAVIPPNYTMATNKPQDIIETYQNGANKYIKRANLQLEEYGTCTSGTAVTFQKPFRDANYALTVPYSAKSPTGFTPSQTGDWKAKGFYSL